MELELLLPAGLLSQQQRAAVLIMADGRGTENFLDSMWMGAVSFVRTNPSLLAPGLCVLYTRPTATPPPPFYLITCRGEVGQAALSRNIGYSYSCVACGADEHVVVY